jgi:hypothetical protein
VSIRSSSKEIRLHDTIDIRRLIPVAIAGLALGSLIILANLAVARRTVGHTKGYPYANVFQRLDNPVDLLFALGDGQSFVALARDPTLSHPEAFLAGKDQAAFRAERPVQGYLGWVFSLGQARWAEEGLMIATILGCSLAAAGCGELLRRRHVSPWLGLVVLELPGSLAAVRQFGPELLGLGLVCFGIANLDDERPWLAITLFSFAGLARETYLLVPLIYVLRDKRFLLPHVVWIGWVSAVWLRFGAFGPVANPEGTPLITAPFVGLAHAISHLKFAPVTALLIVSIPLLILASVRRAPRDRLTHVAMIYGVFAICMGKSVWNWWASFSRPLLPLTAFALIALAGSAVKDKVVIDIREEHVNVLRG